MPSVDLVNIVVTIGLTQLICDILALLLVYQKEPYKRALNLFERSKWKRDKAKQQYEASLMANATISIDPKTGKQTQIAKPDTATSQKKISKHGKLHKQYRRAEEETAEAAAEIARRHAAPGVFTSIFFLLLLRILGTEYQGKIIGVLPFQPFPMLRRITMRGMTFDTSAENNNIVALPNPFEPKIANTYAAKVTDTSQCCAFIFIYLLCTFSVKYYVNLLVGQQAPAGADQGLLTILESPQSKKMLNEVGLPEDVFNEAAGKPKQS